MPRSGLILGFCSKPGRSVTEQLLKLNGRRGDHSVFRKLGVAFPQVWIDAGSVRVTQIAGYGIEALRESSGMSVSE
jgi:hypothetical protein